MSFKRVKDVLENHVVFKTSIHSMWNVLKMYYGRLVDIVRHGTGSSKQPTKPLMIKHQLLSTFPPLTNKKNNPKNIFPALFSQLY